MRIISRSLEETEILVAEERAGLKRDFDLWRDATKERTVAKAKSLRGVGAVAGAGLVMAALLRGRSRRTARRTARQEPLVAPETKRTGLAAILGGLVVTGLRMRYGNPWNALPVFASWSRDQYMRRQAARRLRTAPGAPVAAGRSAPWQPSRPRG